MTAEALNLSGSPTQAEILLRKRSAKSAQPGPSKDGDDLALAKAFVRAGHEFLGMRVRVLSASARTETGIEQLTPVFTDHALCLAGRGSDGETGVIALSLELVTAIIEKSVTGEVGNRAVPERVGTSIDALFAGPLLKAMLENLSLSCAPEIRPWIASAKLASRPSTTNDLEFEIAESAHRVVMLQVQIDGAREGELVALIPQPGKVGQSSGANAEGKSGRSDPATGLRQTLLGSRTSLRADLISLDIPLSEFRKWELGSEIQIPGDAIGAITLTQGRGTSIANGRLGQANGHRAVRLDPLPPTIPPSNELRHPPELPTSAKTVEAPAPEEDSSPPPGPQTEHESEPAETPVV